MSATAQNSNPEGATAGAPPPLVGSARTVRRRAVLSGRVQGVGFRWAAHDEAERRGLAGYVRNLHDGTVEVEVEGRSDAVDGFVQWLRIGPPGAHVEAVATQELAVHGETGFGIR